MDADDRILELLNQPVPVGYEFSFFIALLIIALLFWQIYTSATDHATDVKQIPLKFPARFEISLAANSK